MSTTSLVAYRHGRKHVLASVIILVSSASLLTLCSCTENSPLETRPGAKTSGAAAKDLTNGSSSWTTLTAMPTARLGLLAGVANGILYTFGGFTAYSGIYPVNAVATVEAYDPVSNSWSARAPMPDADVYMDGAALLNGRFYVVGGANNPHSLRIYDPVSDSWSAGPDRPVNSYCGSAGAINGILYVLSGYYGGSRNEFFSFDPSTGIWTQLPGSPNFHCFGTYGVVNGKFYVAGGEDGQFGRYMNIYDPVTNAWSTASPATSTVWEHTTGAVVNGKLYSLTGTTTPCLTPTCIMPDGIVYDPATDSWSGIIPQVDAGGPYTAAAGVQVSFTGHSSDVLAPAPTARQLAAAAVINGQIYVAGGADITNSMAIANLEAYTPPGLASLSYSWDFGDGGTGEGATTSHAYASGGTYNVTLSVTTPSGRVGTAMTTVTVSVAPPIANAGGSYNGVEGSSVSFDGSHSSSIYSLNYAWDFGDGTTGNGVAPSHAYTDNGSYVVRLTVSDGHGGTATASSTATIANATPSVGPITAPTSPVQVGTLITATAAFTDAGTRDTHTATIAWGDGSVSTVAVNEASGSGSASGSHAYSSPGQYTLTTTVADKDGGAGTATFQYVNVSSPPTVSISSNFNGTPIGPGSTIWFNAVARFTGVPSSGGSIFVTSGKLQFSANGTSYTVATRPNRITFSPNVTQATTAFDPVTQTWQTTVPSGYTGNVFLGGVGYTVVGGLPGGINPVAWSAAFVSTTSGLSVEWKWAAAVYTQFPSDNNALGVKPIDGNLSNAYANADHAGTPESVKQYLTAGARGGGGSNWTGNYSGSALAQVTVAPSTASLDMSSCTYPHEDAVQALGSRDSTLGRCAFAVADDSRRRTVFMRELSGVHRA